MAIVLIKDMGCWSEEFILFLQAKEKEKIILIGEW